MASVTIRLNPYITSGTVSVYAPAETAHTSGPPSGSVLTTGVVASNGTVTFTGLTHGKSYCAYQTTPDRYIDFSVPAQASAVNAGVVLLWTANTAYAEGQAVQNASTIYLATDAHTSGSSFAGDLTAHWTPFPLTGGNALLSNDAPLAAGPTAAPGSLNEASRADHVHPTTGFLSFPGGGTWLSPWGQANASTTPVVGDLYLAPFLVPDACVITGLGLVIATQPSSDSRVKLAIYSSVAGDAYWFPGAKTYESTAQGPLTGSTPLTLTGLNIPVDGGLYWFGYVFTVGTTLTGCVEIGPSPALNQNYIVYGTDATPSMAIGNDSRIARQTGVTGTLPDPFAGALANNSNLPLTPPSGLLRIG